MLLSNSRLIQERACMRIPTMCSGNAHMRIPTTCKGNVHAWESPPHAMGMFMHENLHHVQWEHSCLKFLTQAVGTLMYENPNHVQWRCSCMRILTTGSENTHIFTGVIVTTTLGHRWHYSSGEERRQRSVSWKERISTGWHSQEVYCCP